MPQMAPLNWISLYLYFTFLFTLCIILNYYNFYYTPKISLYKKTYKKINWKW